MPRYLLGERLSEGAAATRYRGFAHDDPKRALELETHDASALSEQWIAQCRQRIEHLKALTDPAVLPPIGSELHGTSFVVARDHFDGMPLDELLLRQGRCSLRGFFSLAIQLAQALERIHEAGVVHGGLKPSNVLVRPDTLEVRVVGFVSPLDVRDVSHFIYDPAFIAGTLAYTSPEQTGRINHRVGFTSDLNSLGILCFELLTGAPPFTARDPLELIHAHLAEEPPLAHHLAPAVPPTLSKIIARLLLKQPEKRYQSGAGLRADLQRCSDELQARGLVSDFALATSDRGHRIQFISKMVGRDREVATILAEYERVTSGTFGSVFISGSSGIGKTRLIQELQRPIVRHRGYFASGKFDLYQRNIPYSSLLQAFRSLVRTFLTESDERVAHWRHKIADAVAGNGRVLTDVLPELSLLLGEQPEVRALPPVESRNRFSDVFRAFVSALAAEQTPITLFIDDLQWCDSASFDFLETIFASHREHPYLFFLGAYRDNEVDSSHPLSRLLRRNREAARPMHEIRIGALGLEGCHEMVSYILDSEATQTGLLAQFLFGLTDGNPLFVSESLAYLHHADLLHRDADSNWSWDLERIRRSDMPSSVVALFGAKVRKQPAETIELLELAACMGNRFAPEVLAEVWGHSLAALFEALRPALGQGLLMESKTHLQFIHDRVQEAVLAAISSDARRAIHRRIGQHLLSRIPEGVQPESRDDLFTIVSHLDLGRGPNPSRQEAYQLSRLSFLAGRKALDSLATKAANDYFRLSRALLPEDAWEAQYDLTFQIHRSGAKAALTCGDFDQSEVLLNTLLAHARGDLDKAESLAEQTTSLSSLGDFEKAIATANRGLGFFDRSLPDDPQEATRRRIALMARIAEGGRDVWGTILHMPFTEERRRKIELAFYSELIPDLYMTGLVPQLYLSAAQSTMHCLEGGMDESVIYSFSIMGLQLGEEGDFANAFRYEDLARELSARHPNTFGATRGINGVVWCNAHSRSHPEEIVRYAQMGILSGKSCGDLYNAGLCYGPLMWNLQVQGADLGAVAEYAEECRNFAERYRLSFSSALAHAMQAGWIAPMKHGTAPDIEPALRQWRADRHVAAAGSYFVHRALSHYYLGEYAACQEALDLVEEHVAGLTDNVLKRQWYAFRILAAIANHDGSESASALEARVGPWLERVRQWAQLGPLLRPYLALVEAELVRLQGSPRAARERYADAIGEAHAQRYTLLQAHAEERLSEHLRRTGLGPYRLHVREALELYRRCGADENERRLLAREPDLAAPLWPDPTRPAAAPKPAFTLPDLDVDYLMKSARSISAEIDREALGRRIMDVVSECSGAQHGYLFVEVDGELVVGAESHVGAMEANVGRKVDELEQVCRPLVRYVLRTREKLLLANAQEDSEWRDLAEVRALQPKSVLCLPVLRQGSLSGVLYLENRLAAGVFTPERAQTTELLTSQAAISLENARLMSAAKLAEESLRASLFETEVLLKEVHHRVKNNLQVVSSLLRMQAAGSDDPRLLESLRASQNRVDSMALVHEELHQSNRRGRIEMAGYVPLLASKLHVAFGVDARVKLDLDVEPTMLPLDAAIPCGLFLNEALTNALKHAFPGRGGTVRVLFRAAGEGYELVISDDGVGFTAPRDLRRAKTLGLQLVHALAAQLRGTLEVSQTDGTTLRLNFPAQKSH